MDWFSWLSKSALDPALVYEYGLLLSHNELDEDDVAHFDHEFLRSMGISIAKHRLEILKLAGKARRSRTSSVPPVARLLAAIKKTQRFMEGYVRRLVHGGGDGGRSAIVVLPRASYSTPSRAAAALKRDKKMLVLKHGRLMVTDGGVFAKMPPHLSVGKSPMPRKYGGDAGDDDDDGFWSDSEKIQWDCMFQDMKPT